MLKRLVLILFFYGLPALANDQGIARLNFFPESDAYFIAGYAYSYLEIQTPRETVSTKEVNNYANTFRAKYAHRFGRKMFAGLSGGFESASENAVTYGIPFKRRVSSTGLTDPSVFTRYRLKHQKDDSGLVDLFMTWGPSFGPKKVSSSTTNRFSGRQQFLASLSHGYVEDSWEFRNLLSFSYMSEGEERNELLDRSFRLENTFDITYAFTLQRAVSDDLFLLGEIAIVYRSNQIIRESGGEKREIRSGSGSRFQGGLKKRISDWHLMEANYTLERYEFTVFSFSEILCIRRESTLSMTRTSKKLF